MKPIGNCSRRPRFIDAGSFVLFAFLVLPGHGQSLPAEEPDMKQEIDLRIEHLKGSSRKDRLKAAIYLGRIGPAASKAVPVLVTRGEWDGIASYEDLIEFFSLLPNPDKQFAVMPGISHASLQMKNFEIIFHLIERFFSQPDPIFRG